MDTPAAGITTQAGSAACPAGSCSDHASASNCIGVILDAPNTAVWSSFSANEEECIDEELDALLYSFVQDSTSCGPLQTAALLHASQCLEATPAPSTEPVPEHFQLYLPSHHSASHVNASNMPSPNHLHPPPPGPRAYPNLSARVFAAASSCPAVSHFTSTAMSGSPADDNFDFPYLEIKQKNQAPSAAFYADRHKLTSPISIAWYSSWRSGLQSIHQVPPSDDDDNGASQARSTFLLAFTQSKSLNHAASSDPAITEFSTTTMPFVLPSEIALQTEMGGENLSMPPSPPLSSANRVTGHPSASREESAAAASVGHKAVFIIKLKTKSADLDDGYRWLKYGEKWIKNEKYRRSYYYCDEKKAWGCEVQKHTHKCADDEECFTVTYFGRHNHHPAEKGTSTPPKRDRRAKRKLGLLA